MTPLWKLYKYLPKRASTPMLRCRDEELELTPAQIERFYSAEMMEEMALALAERGRGARHARNMRVTNWVNNARRARSEI